MRRFPLAFRVLAVTLLLSIGQDLAADTLCEPGLGMASDINLVAASSTGESCATVCVPDCFCCCIGAEADRPGVMKDLWRIANPATEAPEPPLDGVSVSIFHPPLLRA